MPRRTGVLPAVGIFLLVVAVFWPAVGHDFLLAYDDAEYVTGNIWVSEGLTLMGIRWAFTTTHAANWHPVTWISHMLDATLFGLRPAGHHLVSVLLHAANAALLFLFLRGATGAVLRSVLVSALFALHPLHVESVAWIAERKDVLSAFFWMLALLAYARFVRRPGRRRYLVLLLVFLFGLLSKPMVLTLPFVLLLLDFWPLGRWNPTAAAARSRGIPWGFPARLLREKIPLFALSGLSLLATWTAQGRGGAIASAEHYPGALRIANALTSYGAYLGKTFWPRNLALIYPHPQGLSASGPLLVATALLAGISLLALAGARRRPYLLMGWLWFLGTLVPVIGLVQVGVQALADRYTYLPLIGVFTAVSWGGADLLRRRTPAPLAPAVALLLLAPLVLLTRSQLGYWRNELNLMTHAIEITEHNWVAHFNLGVYFEKLGKTAASQQHFREAREQYLALRRTAAGPAWIRSGADVAPYGQHPIAQPGSTAGGVRVPEEAREQNNQCVGLIREGRFGDAAARCSAALRLVPEYLEAHNNLGVALAGLGDVAGAALELRAAVRLGGAVAEPQINLGNILSRQGDRDGALESYRRAAALEPDFAEAHLALGDALFNRGERSAALFEYREALRLEAGFAEARRRLDGALNLAEGASSPPAGGDPPSSRYLVLP